jgi:hypothetical protein
MSLFEDFEMKPERIPKRQLMVAWKTLSNKPMPKIKALRLSDEDFNREMENRHCVEDDFREIEEWGRILPIKGTDACVFNADKNENIEFVILIRKNPYHSLEEIIVHELSHISRGDL